MIININNENIHQQAELIAERIMAIPRFTEKHDHAMLKKYLEALNHPESGLFVVHVAGTNGKGSVTRMLRGLLTLTGRKTGGFYSPHLIRINERMEVDGEEITDEEFVTVYYELTETVEREQLPQLTFFETVFILALLFFRKRRAEYVVLETGLGGRLDATTAIFARLYIITQIGLDHEEYLGSTIAAVAAEKAGIITGTSPLVINTGEDEADRVILDKAAEMKVGSVINARDSILENVSISASGIDFSLRNDYDSYQHFYLPAGAEYQLDNAKTVIAASHFLLAGYDHKDREKLLSAMFLGFSWRGRLTEALPGLYLDGAHNPSAAGVLVRSAEHLLSEHNRLIFAASADKNVAGVLKILSGLPWDEVWLVPYTGSRSMKQEALRELVESIFPKSTEYRLFASPKEVVEALGLKSGKKADDDCEPAVKYLKEDECFTLATGSLYLVGELLGYIQASGFPDTQKGD